MLFIINKVLIKQIFLLLWFPLLSTDLHIERAMSQTVVVYFVEYTANNTKYVYESSILLPFNLLVYIKYFTSKTHYFRI